MKKAELAVLREIRLKGDKSGFKTDPERISRGVFYTHIGLARRALRAEFGKDFETYRDGKQKKRTQ